MLICGMPEESRESIIQRRKYQEDIKGDVRSLYVSNYPVTAKYLAKRIANKELTVVELCCGIGATLEQVGKVCKKAIGVDANKDVLADCEANMKNAGVNAELIQGDVNNIELLKSISADIVIYDIPDWYGEGNPDLKEIIEKIRKYISGNILVAVKPNYIYAQIKEQLGECEFEKVFINGKHDRNHVYLGNLIQKEGETEVHLTT